MKQTKKGFTLVELLVVIAILAILATVSVVGYTAFITRANLSNDQAFIAQANTTLQAAAIPNKFESAGAAINALDENGFSGKYTPYSRAVAYSHCPPRYREFLRRKCPRAACRRAPAPRETELCCGIPESRRRFAFFVLQHRQVPHGEKRFSPARA